MRRARTAWPGRAAMLLACSVVVGCETYRPAPLLPASSAQQFAARRLDSPLVQAALSSALPDAASAFPPAAWNRAQLLVAALAQNPRLRQARAERQLALAEAALLTRAPQPGLQLQSEYARRERYVWLYGLALSVPVLGHEQRRSLQLQAESQGEAARWALMQSIWDVRQALGQALCARERWAKTEAILQRLEQAYEALLSLQRQRVDAGEDSPLELLALEQNRAALQQERAEAQSQLAIAAAGVAQALGVTADALQGIEVSWSDWGEPPPLAGSAIEQARERSLLSRADLSIAIADYAGAEAALRRAIAAQHPQVEISPGYYWDHGIAKLPFDIGLSIPSSRTRAQVRQARAARDWAAQRMLSVQARIRGDMDAAATVEAIERANLAAAESQLLSAQRGAVQARTQLQAGAIGAAEEWAARILRLRAELAVVERRAGLQSARLSLEDAMQAPLSGPELALTGEWARLADAERP